MDLLDLLPPEHVVVPLRAPDVRMAIEALLKQLEVSGAIEASDALYQRIRREPLRGLVAVSDAAVLPHYRSPDIDSLTLALGVSREPIPGRDSGVDVQPRVVALILAPQEAANFYLQTISTLARLLRQPGIVDKLAAQESAEDLLALPQLQGLRIQPNLTVRDVMAHRIHSVPPDATVRRVLELMLSRRLNAVPVVGEKGEVLGLVSESDIMQALLPNIPRTGTDEGTEQAKPGEPGDRPVREVMTRSVLCVSDDLGINDVASMMINKDVEQIPVVHEGAITGMVSRSDIIRKLFGRA